jgi:hypothetical protein
MRFKRKVSSSVSTHSTDEPRKNRWKTKHIIISSEEEEEEEEEITDDDKSSDLDEDEWLINCILDETESQYLIDWEGPWTPSWVS